MPTVESDGGELELIVEEGVDIDLGDGATTIDTVIDAMKDSGGEAVLDQRHMVGSHPAYRFVDGDARCAVVRPERRDDGGVTMVHEVVSVEESEVREMLTPAAIPAYIQPVEESLFSDDASDGYPYEYS